MTVTAPLAHRVWDDPRIRMPDAEAWARLDEAAQDRVMDAIEAVFDEHREAMSEGVRHSKRKTGIAGDLDAHFRRAGRGVLLASELAVLYPGEAAIVPDVLAVMDVDPDYEPERWVVTRERRGVDVVIEVRNLGRKHKDLVENVEDYARVQIPEYFSYDCRSNALRGWRLPDASAKTYVPVVPQGGLLRSAVLGLDLAVVRNRLRFFSNGAMVPTESELVTRLQSLVDERQTERDEATRARDEATRARDEATRARDEATRARDEAAERAARFQASLAQNTLQVLALRGVTLTPAQTARIVSEEDPAALGRWAQRAFAAAQGDEVFAEGEAPRDR